MSKRDRCSRTSTKGVVCRLSALRLSGVMPATSTILVLTTVFARGMASRATGAEDDLQKPIADTELDPRTATTRGGVQREMFSSTTHPRPHVLKARRHRLGEVLPDVGKRGLDPRFDNLGMRRRLVEQLTGRLRGAGPRASRGSV